MKLNVTVLKKNLCSFWYECSRASYAWY